MQIIVCNTNATYRTQNLTLTHRNGSSGPVSNFTWVGGPLDATAYQAFPVLIQVPNVDVSQNNATLYFPAVQRWYVFYFILFFFKKKISDESALS